MGGCVATGPLFSQAPAPEGNKALVYVYRIPSMYIYARTAKIFVDGVQAAELNSGGYSYFYVDPGEHTITEEWQDWTFGLAPWKPVGFKASVNAGETRYVRFDSHGCSSGAPKDICFEWSLTEVPAEDGVSDIKTMNLNKPIAAN